MFKTIVKDAPVKDAKDVFAICDLPGLADLAGTVTARRHECEEWSGNKTWAASVDQVRQGDLSAVPASDQLLSELEQVTFASPVWRNRLDVVGGAPCVPAYLAGHPMNMRRRERVASEQGPLTVLVSLELSGGIDTETMRKRGVAILALVRALSNVRPVEVHAICSVGGNGFGAHVAVRLDTAPLDLARAAHVLACPSVTRMLGYSICAHIARKELNQTWRGSWAYNDHNAYRRTARDNFVNVLSPASDALLITAAHLNDPMVKEPLVWLKDMLAQYGGMPSE